MENVNGNKNKILSLHLYKVECGLEGLAGLLRESQSSGSLEGNEFNGVSEIVMLIRSDVLKVKQVLDNPALMPKLEEFSHEIGFLTVGTTKKKPTERKKGIRKKKATKKK